MLAPALNAIRGLRREAATRHRTRSDRQDLVVGGMERPALRVNLIFHDNGAGLTADAMIVASVLSTAGIQITSSPYQAPPVWDRAAARAARWSGRPRYDLNIFLEHVDHRWWPMARRSMLIPNQEWFYPEWTRRLRGFDRVLCKTQDGLRIFQSLGARAEFLGFTSEDRRLLPGPPREEGVLHIAGRSLRKGTVIVLQAWQQHPEWPRLTVVQRPPQEGYPLWHPPLPNVTYHSHRLSDEEIRELQNRYWLHIRPSEAEGFGHPLAESMSCGAVVITTDAPPMNELVRPDRGILVPAHPTKPQGLVIRQEVEAPALEAAVVRALAMPASEREEMGGQGRAWWETNDQAFRSRLKAVVAGVG